MTIQITTAADERTYNSYLVARDAPRQTMAHGVYPNAVKALAEYDALLVRLTTGDLAQFGEYHANVTAAVAPYIATMQQAMQAIVATMQAIEQAAPGTFGIVLPEVPQEQHEDQPTEEQTGDE